MSKSPHDTAHPKEVTVVIRRARAGDAKAIAETFLASRAEMTYLPRLHTDEETSAWIRDVVLPQQDVRIAMIEGVVAGFIAMTPEHVEHLYVAPGYQGRGIGARLLGIAQSSHRRLELWVFQRNEGARRFYERHGFKLARATDGQSNEERQPDALYSWES
jgi:GNAT superfamily N-acetyltransferase